MQCKYCKSVELHWPENWIKGMSPLEEDTNKEHNFDRCQEFQNPQPKKWGWIKRICDCGVGIFYSRLNYSEKTVTSKCSDCEMEITKC